jgi:hypothetical protein
MAAYEPGHGLGCCISDTWVGFEKNGMTTVKPEGGAGSSESPQTQAAKASTAPVTNAAFQSEFTNDIRSDALLNDECFLFHTLTEICQDPIVSASRYV